MVGDHLGYSTIRAAGTCVNAPRLPDAALSGLSDEERERDDADLWELLARGRERAGDRANAKAAWREVMRIDP